MPSLKHFIEAMGASWPVALAIFLGSGGALLGEHFHLHYLATLPEWIFGAAFLLMAFSGAILVVSLLRFLLGLVVKPFRSRKIAKWKAEHLQGLEGIPVEEAHVLAWATVQNTQVFLAPFNHERLEPLIAKGYVEIISGAHSIINWPHRIPDHVWKVLREDLARSSAAEQGREIPNPFSRW